MEKFRRYMGFRPSQREQERLWTSFSDNWDAADLDAARALARFGIPPSLRRRAWPAMADALQLLRKNPGSYGLLVDSACPREVSSAIDRDLGRTFPNVPLFESSNPDAEGRRAMSRVLRAYAVFDPEIAYCQGMNYLVGVLLMHMDEEVTFWTLTQIMRHPRYRLNGLFQEGLGRLISFFGQHEHLLFKTNPELYHHFAEEGVVTSMYAAAWYQTAFAAAFPLPVVFRIWDVFMLEGADCLLQVAMAALRGCTPDLLACRGLDSVQYLKRLPDRVLDAERLLAQHTDDDSPLNFTLGHTGGSRAASAVPAVPAAVANGPSRRNGHVPKEEEEEEEDAGGVYTADDVIDCNPADDDDDDDGIDTEDVDAEAEDTEAEAEAAEAVAKAIASASPTMLPSPSSITASEHRIQGHQDPSSPGPSGLGVEIIHPSVGGGAADTGAAAATARGKKPASHSPFSPAASSLKSLANSLTQKSFRLGSRAKPPRRDHGVVGVPRAVSEVRHEYDVIGNGGGKE